MKFIGSNENMAWKLEKITIPETQMIKYRNTKNYGLLTKTNKGNRDAEFQISQKFVFRAYKSGNKVGQEERVALKAERFTNYCEVTVLR